jgi:hypothetical protein
MVSYRKYLRRDPVRVYPFFSLLDDWKPHFFLFLREALENLKFSSPPSPRQVSLPFMVLFALKSLDKPLQFNCIAICLLDLFFNPFEGKYHAILLHWIVVCASLALHQDSSPVSVLNLNWTSQIHLGDQLGGIKVAIEPSSVEQKISRGSTPILPHLAISHL